MGVKIKRQGKQGKASKASRAQGIECTLTNTTGYAQGGRGPAAAVKFMSILLEFSS